MLRIKPPASKTVKDPVDNRFSSMKVMYRRIFSVMAGVFLTGMSSCELNKIDYDSNDDASVHNEAVASSYFDDASDMSTTAISSADDTKGGKVILVADNRFSCAVVTIEPDPASNIIHPMGVVTADFGSGCADGRGNTRSGKVMIAYSGRRFRPASTVIITFDNYTINGVKMEGTYTVTNSDASTEVNPIYTVTLDGGKLTWPDGTFATRDVAITRNWARTSDQTDVFKVTGSAFGVNRHGKQFTMTITQKLVFQKICQVTHTKFLPSKGTTELNTGDKNIIIDYGTGSCDQQVTITINSKSKTIDLSGNDN